MPNSEAVVMSGMMWPVMIVGSPGIVLSHTCVDLICRPYGRVTKRGLLVSCLFWHGASFVRKKEVVPELAIASEGPIDMPRAC
jgi:hypothetical protein